MSDQTTAPPGGRTIRDFAEERSHRDAVVSNETIRATAQASILINGGAATAILAYLSKSDINAKLFHWVSCCLAGYGLGVVFAACMMFCSIRSLDYYNVSWRTVAFPDGFPNRSHDQDALFKARFWWKYCLRSFWMTMGCFFFSSLFAAASMALIGP